MGYYRISNSAGKQWILNAQHLRMGFQIYQPSSLKGKIVKSVLPILYNLGLKESVFRVIGADKVEEPVIQGLRENCGEAFGRSVAELELNYFAGTPGNHQKMTIQISSGNTLLGYCKVASQQDIRKLFYREQRILDYFEKMGLENIPKCLRCCENQDGETIFIQDTKKNSHSRYVHELTDVHIRFLDEFCQKTRVECNLEDSDYGKMLLRLEDEASWILRSGFSENDVVLLKNAISVIRERLITEKSYSAYHADFTPWNMFMDKKELYVFDFEYACLSYPPNLDIFHFIVQSAIYEKNLSAKEIISEINQKYLGLLKRRFDDPWLSFLAYILSVSEMYIRRDGGLFNKDVQKEMQIRILLINMIIYGKDVVQ